MNIEELRNEIANGNFEWRKHILIRLSERNIAQDKILEVISSGEIIEDYPQDKLFSGCLIFKMRDGIPYHVVTAFDSEPKKVYIITAYNPGVDKFLSDFKTRRR